MPLITLITRIVYIIRPYFDYKDRIFEFYLLYTFVYLGSNRFAISFLKFG
jgi:hypothetical protein